MSQLIKEFRKNPSILFGVAALIVFGAVGFLRANQLSELSDLEAELNAKVDKINANIKHSENIEQDTQKLQNLIETIDKRLFAADERSTNIDFFYSFEDDLDIVISEVDQLERSGIRFTKNGLDNLQRYAVVNYKITVGGTFHEIVRFLYKIHQIDSIMRVSDFQIDVTRDRNGNTGILSAEIHVVVLAAK